LSLQPSPFPIKPRSDQTQIGRREVGPQNAPPREENAKVNVNARASAASTSTSRPRDSAQAAVTPST